MVSLAATLTVVILLGSFMGLGLEKLTAYLIKKRVPGSTDTDLSNKANPTALWMFLHSLAWFLVVLMGGLNAQTIQCALILSACMVLSVVDIRIKKLPNELLLFILIVGASFVVINGELHAINKNLHGFIFGFILFLLPAMIGKGAGWGDVKFAAVAGFCLGIYGFLTAMIIMALMVFTYTAYLFISRKGNLKTKIALGPFLATGFVLVLVLNIASIKYPIFDLGIFLNR